MGQIAKSKLRICTRQLKIHSFIHFFQNALDLVAINAWEIYKEVTEEKITRKEFLEVLLAEVNRLYSLGRNWMIWEIIKELKINNDQTFEKNHAVNVKIFFSICTPEVTHIM